MIKEIAEVVKTVAQVSSAIASITDIIGLTSEPQPQQPAQTQQQVPVQYIMCQPMGYLQQLPQQGQPMIVESIQPQLNTSYVAPIPMVTQAPTPGGLVKYTGSLDI